MAKKKSKNGHKGYKGQKNSTAAKQNLQTKTLSQVDLINTEAILAAALSAAKQPILRACRLCESKDGPFLNIFESEKLLAKKIDDILPFVVGIYLFN